MIYVEGLLLLYVSERRVATLSLIHLTDNQYVTYPEASPVIPSVDMKSLQERDPQDCAGGRGDLVAVVDTMAEEGGDVLLPGEGISEGIFVGRA